MSTGDASIEAEAFAPTVPAPSRVIGLDGKLRREEQRTVAVEVPVQVSFADVPFAVMMLTPSDLVDFAYGFSLTEGMIETADDIRKVTLGQVAGGQASGGQASGGKASDGKTSDDKASDDGVTLRIDLVGDKLHKHLARQRAMTGRTGCGVCGIDDLQALRRAQLASNEASPVMVAAIARALNDLDERQILNIATRAVHGAAWADLTGSLGPVREDVGRHNALDKLIGALLRSEADPAAGFFLITSRCSFEMVEKAAAFGARTLVAISAPTSMAIARAEALDVALVAIARRDTFTVFTRPERILVA